MHKNPFTFTPLDKIGLTNEEIMDTYATLRGAYENSHPDRMVDASDAYVLTVFPFAENDEWPEDYEVTNYETGFYQGKPALRNCSDKKEILYISDGIQCLTSTYHHFY